MTLTDEQLDALAMRLHSTYCASGNSFTTDIFRDLAREAARWAEERSGEAVEVVWEYRSITGAWLGADATNAARLESEGVPVRAIRVITTTTREVR